MMRIARLEAAHLFRRFGSCPESGHVEATPMHVLTDQNPHIPPIVRPSIEPKGRSASGRTRLRADRHLPASHDCLEL